MNIQQALNKKIIHPNTFIGLMDMKTKFRYLDANNDNAEKILKVVIENYNISGEQITSAYRGREVTEARHVFSYLCREVLHMPVTEIGKLLNRDHSTAIYGWNQVKDLSDSYDKYRIRIQKIEAECWDIISRP